MLPLLEGFGLNLCKTIASLDPTVSIPMVSNVLVEKCVAEAQFVSDWTSDINVKYGTLLSNPYCYSQNSSVV